MLNYIKGECYRIFHSKEVYILTAIFTALLAAYNVILYMCRNLPGFDYCNTRHAYGMIDMSMSVFIYIIVVICSLLDGSSIKNMKNAVAFGINRRVIYFGRIIVHSGICLVMYLYLMGFHLWLGKMMLEDSGTEVTEAFIRSMFVCIPMFLGVVAAYQCFVFMNKNSLISAVYIITVLDIVPRIIGLMGYKIAQAKKIGDMLMYNLMQVKVVETPAGYAREYTWDTGVGITKCMIAGISAILIFSLVGMKYFQKKEIR